MKEALKLALEALDGAETLLSQMGLTHLLVYGNVDKSITAIKEALAQPEQEPVAYGMWDTMIGCGGRMMMVRLDKGQDGCTVPLYTTPPQRTWVGLSREDCYQVRERESDAFMYGVAWAEAKLKEKNT